MSSPHGTLILFISLLIITVGGIAVFYEVTSDLKEGAQRLQSNTEQENTNDELELVSSVGYSVQNDTFKYVRFQVRYEGEGSLNLNDTFVQVRTDTSIADLRYRNGTTTRNVNTGFYTG
jgi:archaellum component FlaG (FlaF/FlaG flagellin family)